jgi:hypothetical protein
LFPETPAHPVPDDTATTSLPFLYALLLPITAKASVPFRIPDIRTPSSKVKERKSIVKKPCPMRAFELPELPEPSSGGELVIIFVDATPTFPLPALAAVPWELAKEHPSGPELIVTVLSPYFAAPATLSPPSTNVKIAELL